MRSERQLRSVTETSWVVSYGGKTIPRKSIYRHLSEKSSDFNEILYTAANFELNERHVIKNENFQSSRWRMAAILKIVLSPYLSEQVALLSQRGRAMLRVCQ